MTVSCNNKITNPSEIINGITHYNTDNAEIDKFYISRYTKYNEFHLCKDVKFKKIAESSNVLFIGCI
ncbi:hypothetical protein SZ50_04645 [Brachyspira hyodysenteriae]|nr:hypothetical protein SZ50_04645 [Brachyspira hyodysenteriae]